MIKIQRSDIKIKKLIEYDKRMSIDSNLRSLV